MTSKRVLNEHTGTVHKLRGESIDDEAVCGALRHVSQRHVAPIGTDRAQADREFDRCGRCFEDAGGY